MERTSIVMIGVFCVNMFIIVVMINITIGVISYACINSQGVSRGVFNVA